MKRAILYRYSLPMDSGVILRDQRITHREGLVVGLSIGGRSALGEIAPLPGFSNESLEDVINQTKTMLQHWCQGEVVDYEQLFPSVAFGFSFALHDLEGHIPQEGQFQVAPLCSGDPDELIEKLAVMQGEKIAKIKVGLYEAIRDGIHVNMLFEAISDLKLRLDANQQWTLEKALKFASYIKPEYYSRIDFIEEPCQTKEQSLEFAEQTKIALAWDETTRDADFVLQADEEVNTIVLKPSLIGSIDKLINIVNQAQQLNLQVVISSSLESSLGLTHLARLANWLTPNTLPGLDTNELFKSQLEISWHEAKQPITALTSCELLWQS